MINVQNFQLDVSVPAIKRLRLVNGDTANQFVITVTNNRTPVTLDASLHKVIAVFKRADGQVYTQDANTGVSFTTSGVVTVDVRPASFRTGTNTICLQIYKRENSSATVYPLLLTTQEQSFNARAQAIPDAGAPNAPSQLPMLEQYVLAAKSYANGNTGTREGENTDNAKYYAEMASEVAIPSGSITEQKLSNELKLKVIKDYVTPEMFGAKGDGETDDTAAFASAIADGNTVMLNPSATYVVSSVDVSDCCMDLNGAKVKGTLSVGLNGTVKNGTVQGSPSIRIESKRSDGRGYVNARVQNMNLIPGSSGVGIYIYANANPLFGYVVENIDIDSCLDSIHIDAYNWITKGTIKDVFCHTPSNSVVKASNNTTNPSFLADIEIHNVYAQYWNHYPTYFLDNSAGPAVLTFIDSFVYDGIESCVYHLSTSPDTRITIIGDFKSTPSASSSFTNASSLRAFYFESHGGTKSKYQKVETIASPPVDYYGSLAYGYSSTKGAVGGKFFGLLARLGINSGSSVLNKIFGITFYDGRLGVVRGTDGTADNLSKCEVTTPYSGGIYTTATLPTSVLNGATCWCSDIHMAVTYYDGSWYKPDGTTVS